MSKRGKGACRSGLAEVAKERSQATSSAATALKLLSEMITTSRFSWKERQEKDNHFC